MAKATGKDFITNKCVECVSYAECVSAQQSKCKVTDYDEYQYMDFNCMSTEDLRTLVSQFVQGKYFANEVLTKRACAVLRERDFKGTLPF